MQIKKPKIAVIGVKGLPGFGGAAKSTEALLEKLKYDFDITVYSIDSHTSLKGDYHGINQITFKSSKLKKINTIKYYLKSMFHCLFIGKYDLIHVQHIYAGFIIPFLRIRYKVINTVRGLIPSNDNKWTKFDILFFRIFEYFSLKYSNEIVSVCAPHINYLQKRYNRDISYIPNGVSIEYNTYKNQQLYKEEYICFSAGRIIGLKGCHLLLEALQKLKYNGKIKIIGSLEHVESYKEYIHQLSEGLNVEFLGLIKNRDQLYKIVSNSKLFIFPSLNEGMSNMLLETAALKTPIISSDIVENKYIFNDEEVLFFKSNDVNDLVRCIDFALHNMDIMKLKSENALKKIKHNHDWEVIKKEYKELYLKLISKHEGIN